MLSWDLFLWFPMSSSCCVSCISRRCFIHFFQWFFVIREFLSKISLFDEMSDTYLDIALKCFLYSWNVLQVKYKLMSGKLALLKLVLTVADRPLFLSILTNYFFFYSISGPVKIVNISRPSPLYRPMFFLGMIFFQFL